MRTLQESSPLTAWPLFAAIVLSSLLAFQLSPSATILNQLVAILGWGATLLFWRGNASHPARRAAALVAGCELYAVGAVISQRFLQVPTSLALSVVSIVTVAVVTALAGAADAAPEGRRRAGMFAWALVTVGVANAAIAVIQVFWPALADGTFIAASGLPGRAVGNLRQPNHLGTLALWSAVAVVPLMEACGRRWRAALAMLFAAFIFSVELSASRTGMIGVAVLALWGVLDRRLNRATRLMLLAGVAAYAIGWVGMDVWAHHGHHIFGAEQRLGQKDISSSRFKIWSETLALIRANPWTGVGINDFNFAWTLTPFPGRPPEFFDHSHNIVLEMVVELGVPLGAAVVALLALALWQAYRRAWSVAGPRGVAFRAAFVVVLLVAIHSQLEYPLWYAYFLLPTAWAWGYCLGAVQDDTPPIAAVKKSGHVFFRVAGLLTIIGVTWAFQQYLTVSHIFEAGDGDRPLPARIAAGQRTLFYAHHADYAAVTVADRPSDRWNSFQEATHYLLDTRLMIAWAEAFAERGDLDRARYIAARLREFNRPESDEFFAPCSRPETGAPLPFQCEAPRHPHDWREFRDPALYR